MELIGLRDGRRLAMHRLAEGTTGRTVVLCHPAPGSGVFDPDPEVTWARGVTLLSPDRPGYGSSDPLPAGASGFAAADDLAEALDQLGTGPVGLVGLGSLGLGSPGLGLPDLSPPDPMWLDPMWPEPTRPRLRRGMSGSG